MYKQKGVKNTKRRTGIKTEKLEAIKQIANINSGEINTLKLSVELRHKKFTNTGDGCKKGSLLL